MEPYEDEETEYRDDRLALAVILRAVPAEMLRSLSTKRTAQSAWEAIKTVCVGTRRVREANKQLLRQEFADARFKDDENMTTSPCASPESQTAFALSEAISPR